MRRQLERAALRRGCLRTRVSPKFNFRWMDVPADGTGAAIGRSGDFGTSPFFLQLGQVTDLAVFL